MEFCKNSVDGDLDLTGMRIVVDAANGATYKVASKLFWELGAQVIRLGTEPDGFNINRECGALHPENMASYVKDHGADLGIALDGDGDRLIICDEKGQVIDGDQIMAAVGSYMNKHGLLKGGAVVATQMSNMGLEKHLKSIGLDLIRTQVGDRYVMEAMREGGYNFGGEASGHLILSDYATTGDGLLAGLKFLEVMKAEGARASVLGSTFKAFPQKMNNIRLGNFDEAAALMGSDKTKAVVDAASEKLGGSGRVLVRKSGTEPLVRVMVEAEDMALVDEHLGHLTEQIQG
jgi:phosphoglucosamine mutase